MYTQQLHRRVSAALATTALIATLAACGSDTTTSNAVDDAAVVATDAAGVVDSAVDRAEAGVNDLAQTLRDEGLDSAAGIVEKIDVSQLVGDGDFTFLAPNNDAFTSLSADDMADLLSEPSQILDTLRNHTLEGTYSAADLADMTSVDTRAGETLPVSVDGDTITIGDVTVVKSDVAVTGGMIHVVDGFLLPS